MKMFLQYLQQKLVDQSRVMLSDLLPQKRYCVEVEIVMDYTKNSLPSNITCELNTTSGECPARVVPRIFFNLHYCIYLMYTLTYS